MKNEEKIEEVVIKEPLKQLVVKLSVYRKELELKEMDLETYNTEYKELYNDMSIITWEKSIDIAHNKKYEKYNTVKGIVVYLAEDVERLRRLIASLEEKLYSKFG